MYLSIIQLFFTFWMWRVFYRPKISRGEGAWGRWLVYLGGAVVVVLLSGSGGD